MKKIKFFLLMAMVMTMSLNVMADDDDDRVITYDQLPQTAQAFLKANFATKVPLLVTADWDDFTIRYESGEKIEFDKQGNWKEIDCRATLVPVELIPEEIKANIQATFPDAIILKIDRNRRGYEVKLNNGMEVEFNRNFQFIGVDYDD